MAHVNAKLAQSETKFTQCSLVRNAFDLQEAQETTLEAFGALSQINDAKTAPSGTEKPKLSRELEKSCLNYAKNCFKLLEDNPDFRRSIRAHNGGKKLLLDLAAKVLYGPITDVAIAPEKQILAYKEIGFEEVEGSKPQPLSALCESVAKDICDIRRDVCKWNDDNKCQSKTESTKYTVMYCRGCTGANPIISLTTEPKSDLERPKEENYYYQKLKDNERNYIVLKRSIVPYEDFESSTNFVSKFTCTALACTSTTAVKKKIDHPENKDEWWNSPDEKTKNVRFPFFIFNFQNINLTIFNFFPFYTLFYNTACFEFCNVKN